jgi:hypothetical protein
VSKLKKRHLPQRLGCLDIKPPQFDWAFWTWVDKGDGMHVTRKSFYYKLLRQYCIKLDIISLDK